MPLPAILAAVGRVAAAGAEVFASQAARTAATGAVKQAAASAAPVTQAGSVLTTAPGNAKAITSALRGLPPAVPPGSPAAAGQGWAKTLPSPPPPGSGGNVPRPSPRDPAARPMPNQPASRPPPLAAPPSALERIGKFAEGMGAKYRDAKAKLDPFQRMRAGPSKSVEDETKGMTIDQRFKRLQQGGSLLSHAAVSKETGNANPSIADAVGASERAEQSNREQADKNRGESEKAGKSLAVAGLGAAGGLAGIAATWPLMLAKSAQGIEQWTTGLMESRRDLRRFDGSIANIFAKLDRQALMMTARRATATSGSTTKLGESLGSLKRELEPLITAGVSTANLLASIAAQMAGWAARAAKWSPLVAAWMRWMRISEAELTKKQGGGGEQYAEFIKKVSAGDFAKPKNYRPGPDEF